LLAFKVAVSLHTMNKTIFITGATSGFGEACAERYAADGDKLVLTGRRVDRLQKLQQQLQVKVPVHIVQLDVRNAEAVNETVSSLPSEFQEIDVLVNNAGLALGLEPAHKTDPTDWEQMIDTNIKGLTYCTRTILPGMVERNRGHIVNLGSVAGAWPYAGGNVYGATKAFVAQFSRNLRSDLLGTNIRVTNIEPGLANTEFSLVRFKGDESLAEKPYCNVKPLTATDIADLIFFVTSVPEHININALEVMPTCQAWGGLKVNS